MEIDKATVKRWKVKIKGGEKKIIAKKKSLSPTTVSNAFKGHCSEETKQKIDEYFTENPR